MIIYTKDKRDYINIKLKFKLLEYFFVLCADEKSICGLMTIVFSPYLNLSTTPSSFEEFFKIIINKIQKSQIQNHSNSGGMTLACLYFLLHLSNSTYSHLIDVVEPLILKEEQFNSCQVYTNFLEDNSESKEFCFFILSLLSKYQK